jgi:hypothetical protein
MHRVCAAAIVQGVLQQATAISKMLGRILTAPYRRKLASKSKPTH